MSLPNAVIAFFPVADLERTHRFYAGMLGLPLALDQGACRIYRVAEGGYVGFCARAGATAAEGVIVTIVTEDVDAWHRRVVEAGVETDGAPRLNPKYGIYHFYTIDPDGWAVEVQRFEDPRWS